MREAQTALALDDVATFSLPFAIVRDSETEFVDNAELRRHALRLEQSGVSLADQAQRSGMDVRKYMQSLGIMKKNGRLLDQCWYRTAAKVCYGIGVAPHDIGI